MFSFEKHFAIEIKDLNQIGKSIRRFVICIMSFLLVDDFFLLSSTNQPLNSCKGFQGFFLFLLLFNGHEPYILLFCKLRKTFQELFQRFQ